MLDNSSRAMRRAWHCVAHAHEVGDTPVQAWLLDEPWVLVRLDGVVHAFVDRCPHRLAPLSAGEVVDGPGGQEVRCGYHGWRFRADGRAAAVPALGEGATLPPRACLSRPFAVEERFGLVFLAPEEPRTPLPEFPDWDEPRFLRATCETVRTPVSAAQLVDNFMDAAHFPFVHAASFGVEEAEEVDGGSVTREDWRVLATFAAPYKNHDDPLVATGEHPLVQPHRVTKVGRADYMTELRLEFELTGGTFWIFYACTPERSGTTRVYKLLARDDLGHDPARMAQVVADEDRILVEDLAIMERFEAMELSLDLTVEVHTRADRLSVAWRRMVAEAVGATVPVG